MQDFENLSFQYGRLFLNVLFRKIKIPKSGTMSQSLNFASIPSSTFIADISIAGKQISNKKTKEKGHISQNNQNYVPNSSTLNNPLSLNSIKSNTLNHNNTINQNGQLNLSSHAQIMHSRRVEYNKSILQSELLNPHSNQWQKPNLSQNTSLPNPSSQQNGSNLIRTLNPPFSSRFLNPISTSYITQKNQQNQHIQHNQQYQGISNTNKLGSELGKLNRGQTIGTNNTSNSKTTLLYVESSSKTSSDTIGLPLIRKSYSDTNIPTQILEASFEDSKRSITPPNIASEWEHTHWERTKSIVLSRMEESKSKDRLRYDRKNDEKRSEKTDLKNDKLKKEDEDEIDSIQDENVTELDFGGWDQQEENPIFEIEVTHAKEREKMFTIAQHISDLEDYINEQETISKVVPNEEKKKIDNLSVRMSKIIHIHHDESGDE